MRLRLRMSSTAAALLALILIGALLVEAQPGAPKGGKGAGETVDQFVAKLMAFNKAKDGKLTKQELTDTRLHALFDRADADKNGTVTRPELEALFAKEALPAGGFGEKGKGPPDKKGPPKKKGPPPMLVT